MSWLLAIAGFAALIILHEAGHFAAAKAVGMRVERFFLFFPPKLLSVRRGDTEYGIGAIPLGGFVKISGMNPDEELPAEVRPRAYYAQPVWKRIVVIAAGPVVNLVVAFLILFALGFGVEEPTSVAVSEIVTESPADERLEPGDEVIAINGVRSGDGPPERQAERLAGALAGFRCAGGERDGCRATEPAPVVVRRDGRVERFEIRPYYDAGVDGGRFRFGFAFAGAGLVPVDFGPGESAEWALDRMWFVTSRTAEVISRIFEAEQREQISGIVGITEVTRQSIEFDARQAIGILGVISLSLALMNLLPFLPLDGGHIFWAALEKLRGRPVSFAVMERASIVGIALVGVLFFIGLSNDIDRLTGDGFDVR